MTLEAGITMLRDDRRSISAVRALIRAAQADPKEEALKALANDPVMEIRNAAKEALQAQAGTAAHP